MKICILACLLVGLLIGGGAYWYSVDGKHVIKGIQQADHKPFFFD